MSEGKVWTAEDVANALADAVRPGTPTPETMVGAAAFVSALILQRYPSPGRKQQVVNFANAVLDMVIRVEMEAARRQMGLEPLEEGEQAEWKKWVQ